VHDGARLVKELAIEILAGFVILVAIAIGGYSYGVHVTDNAWQAKQAKADREQNLKYEAEVARGDTAVASYLSEHRDQEDRYEALDDQFKALRKRVPLTVPAHVPVAPPVGTAAASAALPDAGTPGRIELSAGDHSVPRLSLGAVWMWNSALAGRDVPAGACGATAAAGGTEAACTEDSGLDVDDAWANQEENARSCARDRQRLKSLIEFLKGRK
jgi:hypothetical protein